MVNIKTANGSKLSVVKIATESTKLKSVSFHIYMYRQQCKDHTDPVLMEDTLLKSVSVRPDTSINAVQSFLDKRHQTICRTDPGLTEDTTLNAVPLRK